jgi:hypothetical protein
MCIFSKIQLFTLVFFSFYLRCFKIIHKTLKMFCLTLVCVVVCVCVCVSRDGWSVLLLVIFLHLIVL